MVERLGLVSLDVVVVVGRHVQVVNVNVLGDRAGVVNVRWIEGDVVTLHIRPAGHGDVTALTRQTSSGAMTTSALSLGLRCLRVWWWGRWWEWQ